MKRTLERRRVSGSSIKEKTPEVAPRDVETEAEHPDDAAPVSLVAAEEIAAYPEVAFACVGLRTDFANEAALEASEPRPPIPLSQECCPCTVC